MTGDNDLDRIIFALIAILILTLVNCVVGYIRNLNCKCEKFKLVSESDYYNIDLKRTTVFKLECVCCGRVKFKEIVRDVTRD